MAEHRLFWCLQHHPQETNTRAKLMLRRSNYLKGQKGLGHWDTESKSGYLVISTIPSRHMHSAVIIQWAEYGNKQREAALQIKLCSKCSFSQLLFEMEIWNHGATSTRVRKGVTGWKSALRCNGSTDFFPAAFQSPRRGGMVRASPQPRGDWGALPAWPPAPHREVLQQVQLVGRTAAPPYRALQLIKLTTKLEVLLFLTGNAFFNNSMPEETLIFAVSCSALVL